MPVYKCPYCGTAIPTIEDPRIKITSSTYKISFEEVRREEFKNRTVDDIVELLFYKCPECKKISIMCNGFSDNLSNIHVNISPNSPAIIFPDYVPEYIRQDYEEAYAILYLSPKASATLSRRCLQGMIRDFWGITKHRLIDEIKELKNEVDPTTWKAIDGV